MRAVVQRVSQSNVEVEGQTIGSIKQGLLVLLGVAKADTTADCDYLARKIVGLRIFEDETGKMNRSVIDVQGGVLVVSQFTLYADTRKGMRPSFTDAAKPPVAKELYDYFVSQIEKLNGSVQTGVFQADMKVNIINDGPVTIVCESVKISAAE